MAKPESRQFDIQYPAAPSATHVVVGAGMMAQLPAIVGRISPTRGVAVVYDNGIPEDLIHPFFETLDKHGFQVTRAPMTASETRKQLKQVETLLSFFLSEGLERTSPIIAIGGGITGDIAGFAAATYLRGVPFINIPTTLLAMIDASIGGKTGVNMIHPRTKHLGKNLIGAFHQPRAVLADVEALRTLPRRIFNAGLAEAIKHALLGDARLFEQLEDADGRITLDSSDEALIDFVARNMQVKASIVQRDEHESGIRMHLNLGHTFAHAIEAVLPEEFEHGEAVALGLIAAAVTGVAHHVTPASLSARVQSVVMCHDLPTAITTDRPMSDFILAMRSDKKRQSARLRLVLPTAVGTCKVFDDVPAAAVEAGWKAIGVMP